MVSKFDICSRSLVELGEDTISSFTANTAPSKICGLIYPEYVKYLLSIHPWKFTLKKVQLARLTTSPLNEWKYAYQLPADMLILRAVYNSSSTSIQPITSYELFQNQIYTNETTVYIDHQFQPDESLFPPFFTEFVIKALAAKLAMAITDDKALLELKKVEAFGSPSDNLNGGEFGIARKVDSLQNPTTAIPADDLASIRFS
jgi:hypothetical protein